MVANAAEQQLPIPEDLVPEVQGSGIHVAGIFLQSGEASPNPYRQVLKCWP